MADDLVELGVERNGFLAWEYYFAFGGGSPPWISGMAQGTAMQALARAGNRLTTRRWWRSRRAPGAPSSATRRTGVRVPQSGGGDWYALYSFAPRLYVLNGHLQAVNGLRTYAEFAPADTVAAERFQAGDVAAKARIASFDTGRMVALLAALLEAGPGGEPQLPHAQPRLRAQPLQGHRRARRTATRPTTSPRYLKQDPTVDPHRAVPAPAVAGKGVRFRFKLSKVGRVGIVVRYGGKTYLSTSASFQHGERYIRWVPPRVSDERTYTYTLFAKDLVGNSASADGEVRVKGAPKQQGPQVGSGRFGADALGGPGAHVRPRGPPARGSGRGTRTRRSTPRSAVRAHGVRIEPLGRADRDREAGRGPAPRPAPRCCSDSICCAVGCAVEHVAVPPLAHGAQPAGAQRRCGRRPPPGAGAARGADGHRRSSNVDVARRGTRARRPPTARASPRRYSSARAPRPSIGTPIALISGSR